MMRFISFPFWTPFLRRNVAIKILAADLFIRVILSMSRVFPISMPILWIQIRIVLTTLCCLAARYIL